MGNSLPQKARFSVAITTKEYQDMIHNTLRDPIRASRFIADISSSVAVTPTLYDCNPGTILAGALLGETLNLPPSPKLGYYYLVPFKSKAKYDKEGNMVEPEMTKAQFILGYKGYIQLAIRSGFYKKLTVLEIKEGELTNFDPLNEVIDCVFISDYDAREAAPTTGYYAMFEYLNGFRKAIYWSKQKMLAYADKYSKAFSAEAYLRIQNGEISDKDMWKYSSFWYSDFDVMAKKTMLRQLLSQWGLLSTEMRTAYLNDDSALRVQGESFLPEGETTPPQVPEHTAQTIPPEALQPEASQTVQQASLDDF